MSRICLLAVLLALAAVFFLAPDPAHAAAHPRSRAPKAASRKSRAAVRQPRAASRGAASTRNRNSRHVLPPKTPAVSRIAGRRSATSDRLNHRSRTAPQQHVASISRRSRHATTSTSHAHDVAVASINGNPGPRGATPEDFLAAARATQPNVAAVAPAHTPSRRPSHAYATNALARPTSVVSIIRPIPQRPQLPSIADAVEDPIVLPRLTSDRSRLLMPAPLRGSHEILVHQNQMADDDGLGRVQDDNDLDAMRRKGMLVLIPESTSLRVDDRLPANRRLCRPWTAQFLANLSHAHYTRFGTSLQLNSAVRTVAFQQRLLRTNGNAAPAIGDTASPHLTGQAVDLAKHGLSLTEIAWMRGYLLPLIDAGKIDVEEEFQQSCFHISVYRKYLPPEIGPERYTVASRGMSPALATSLP